MILDTPHVSVILTGLVPSLVLFLALLVDRKRAERMEKAPQEGKLLRPPGYSLSLRLIDTWDKVFPTLFVAVALSLLGGFATFITVLCLALNVFNKDFWQNLVEAVLFTVAAVVLTIRAFRLIRETRNIRLGLRGEQAVGEALNDVGDCGFRAFHDFPAGENWNIDHVAVGTRGVFLIETKARSRRPSRNGQPGHVVVYDGATLQFPSGTDAKAIPQAQRNARWLSEYLTKKTGEPVAVEAVVALPGWFVEAKGIFPIKVMNASYLAGHLRRQGEKIEPAQVRRIAAALDEKCRDLEF